MKFTAWRVFEYRRVRVLSSQLKSDRSDFQDAPPPFSLPLPLSHVVSPFLIKLILWPLESPHLIMSSSFETFNVFTSCFKENTLLGSSLTPFLCLLPSLWCRCSLYLPEAFLCLGYSSYLPKCSRMFLDHSFPKHLSDISQRIDSEANITHKCSANSSGLLLTSSYHLS